MDDVLRKRLDLFLADLRTKTAADIFNQHVVEQECFAITAEEHNAIKQAVAKQFDMPDGDIIIVGSGKLGFTLVDKSTDSRHRPRYSPFDDLSDIDVAIINELLFDDYWEHGFALFRSGVYWPDRERFQSYLLRGWINPKLLLDTPAARPVQKWKTFLRKLTRSGTCGDYPINAAVYRAEKFLNAYHCDTIEKLKSF